jgi:pilus assembly protein CpaB
MNGSMLLRLGLSVILALGAVVGVRTYLEHQRSLFAGAQATPLNTIVVASRPLRFGQPLRPEDVRTISWPSKELPAGGFRSLEDLLGKDGGKNGEAADLRYAMSAIEIDEPILTAKITGPGQRATLSAALTEGMKAVSIRVNDVLGVAGFVLPGDRVDILLTRNGRNDNDGGQTYVDVLLQGVKVLAIDQTADDRTDKPSVVKTVTFEVTTSEAQQLTLAAIVGTLSLTLRNVASSGIEATEPVTLADLGGGRTAQTMQIEGGGPAGPVAPAIVVPPPPEFVVIGVSRNAKRKEYRVRPLY